MGHKLAIDFGTTNSVIARWNDESGTTEIIAIPGLSADHEDSRRLLIPSLVYVQDGRSGQVMIGQPVLESGLDQQKDNRLFRNFKRGIAAGAAPEPRIIDGAPWTDRAAGGRFLRELINALPLLSEEVEQLVVTVPVAAFEGYAAWLSEAIQEPLSGRVRIVDESTAAALGYAITEPNAVVMVLDFGGGSLDLSLVRLPESREKTGSLLDRLLKWQARKSAAHVIAKVGVNLGGSDIDQWLLAEVANRTGLSTQGLGKSLTPFLTACEQAKVALSTAEATTVDFQTDDGQLHSVPFQRVELEALMEENGFYVALREAADRVMSVARRQGIFREDIDHVLLVGGTSLIPSVQQTIKGYFRDVAVQVDKPFTAVAEGALQVAVGFGLDDHLAHSYGLRYLDPETGEHGYDEVIPLGSCYPRKRPVKVLLSAAHPDQEAVEFVISQIDTDAVSMVEVKYEDGQAVFVAQTDSGVQQIVPLSAVDTEPTLVYLDPPGSPGEDRLRAEFTVDERRRLRLTVIDLQTDEELLRDVVVVTLGKGWAATADEHRSTGREPCLSSYRQPGQQRLSLRRLATTLNLLPPESISLEAAAEALHSGDCVVRYSAAEILSRRGDRDARRVIQDVLADDDAPLRASVVRHLHRFSWFVAEPLLWQALEDADQRVRESAIFALCEMRTRDAFHLLEEVLPNESDTLRLAAAWGLGDSRDARAVPVLGIALQAQSPEVREVALESLGATEASEAIPIVRRAIDDASLEVRYAATLSLLELAGEECFPELAAIIERTCGPERLCILRGFFHATNYLQIDVAQSSTAEVVISALEAALLDDLPGARVAAAMPLAWMRHDRATAILREGYHREQNSETQAHILRAAVHLMSAAGEELLQDALESQDTLVREAAEYLAHSRATTSSA